MWRIFIGASILMFVNMQAMETKKRVLAKTYLRECNRSDLKKDGFCKEVSGNGITITAQKKEPTIKLTTRIRKFTDTSNNPEFKTTKVENFAYSFQGLRAVMKGYSKSQDAEDNIAQGTECKESSMSPYLDKSSGRMQRASDLECVTYVSRSKLMKLNEVRLGRRKLTAAESDAFDENNSRED